jgi:leucyl aminopeptidase (aminopeptidase T)
MNKPIRLLHLAACLAQIAATLVASSVLSQQVNPDYSEMAARVVKTSAGVKPGDVVIIQGGKHTVDLMEEVAIQAAKAGGMVTMLLDSDRFERAIYHEVPEEYLDSQPTRFAEWLKHADVFIGLPAIEDDKLVRAETAPRRSAKINKSDQVVWEALTNSQARIVWLNYPSRSDAASSQIDFTAYQKATWRAAEADYQHIREQGRKLKELLQAGKSVRVTSPSGTDLTFTIGDRRIVVADGIAGGQERPESPQDRATIVPSGMLYFAPVETSGNGRVFVPRDRYHGQPLLGQSFEFVAGHMVNYKAEQGGELFQKRLTRFTGPKDVLGLVQIGLNPEIDATDAVDYRLPYAAGLVGIGIGENQFLGGENKVTGDGFGGFNFPLTEATVAIDGRVIVRDGKLTL